jgi:hypothetical protein
MMWREWIDSQRGFDREQWFVAQRALAQPLPSADREQISSPI